MVLVGQGQGQGAADAVREGVSWVAAPSGFRGNVWDVDDVAGRQALQAGALVAVVLDLIDCGSEVVAAAHRRRPAVAAQRDPTRGGRDDGVRGNRSQL